jgi:hypothetical protein
MLMTEHTMLLIARERMEDAARCADTRRARRAARPPRRRLRAALGMVLVRLGRRLLADPVTGSPSPIEPRRAEC